MEESSKYINKFLLTLQREEDTLNQDYIKTCMKITDQTLSHSQNGKETVDKIFRYMHGLDVYTHMSYATVGCNLLPSCTDFCHLAACALSCIKVLLLIPCST